MIEHFPDPCGAGCVARGSLTDTVDGREHDGCPEATTRFAAPELVALAKKAAHEWHPFTLARIGDWLHIQSAPTRSGAVGGMLSVDAAPLAGAVFSLRLTPENAASEDALARALLASEVGVEWHGDSLTELDSVYRCTLAERSELFAANDYDDALARAVDAFFTDYLLAPTEGR
jgi:hypothetical protein